MDIFDVVLDAAAEIHDSLWAVLEKRGWTKTPEDIAELERDAMEQFEKIQAGTMSDSDPIDGVAQVFIELNLCMICLEDGDIKQAISRLTSAAWFLGGTETTASNCYSPGSALAKKRHAENYALAEEALKHWKENIDPTLSASKAADKLIGVVPLSHKKLSEIISAAKKGKATAE